MTDGQRIESYDRLVGELRGTWIPETRIEGLVGVCESIRTALADDGQVSPDRTRTLGAVVAEAINDLRAATVVTDEADLPADRALAAGVPASEYVLTVAEREAALDVLSDLLLLATDTPTGGGDSEHAAG